MKEGLVEGELDAIASCVPFEEPLPGLRHLVFCHPVPTREYFARCCAPAVETDELVYVHLIFNSKDVDSLTAILNQQYPDRQTLVNVYRKIKELATAKNNAPVPVEEIVESMNMDEPKDVIVSSCIAVFGEIDLAEAQQTDGKTSVSLPSEPQERRELQESQRYATGDRIKNEWSQFSGFILKKTAEEIRKMLLEMVP